MRPDRCSSPNPARGRSVTFKYRVWDDSEVTVRVYDVTGTHLTTLSQTKVLGGTVGSVDWDISGKASGVYVFVVEARGHAGQKSRISKKFAIIH